MSASQSQPIAKPRRGLPLGLAWRAQMVGLLCGLVLLVAPSFLPGWLLFLLTIAFAKALVVLGVVMLLRGDLVSFGHGVYYATGAYAVAYAIQLFGIREAVLLALVGTVAALALAALLGLFLARYRGIFFGMLTTAFAMILYSLLLKQYQYTGGTDGLRVSQPFFFGSSPGAMIREFQYYFVLLIGGLAVYVSYRVASSPLGYLLRAIWDNEIRVEYMGASARRVIYRTYLLAGALGGLGGALTAMSVGHVTPDLSYWTFSGEFVFVALLGGTGSVFAPIIASAFFEFVRNFAYKQMPYTWQLLVGGTMLVIILFAPGGLWSLIERVTKRGRVTPTALEADMEMD